MSNEDRIEELEAILARFLQPMRGIPFPVVIRALAGTAVLPIDREDGADQGLIACFEEAAALVGTLVRRDPIKRNRPNEVGNDIEPFVIRSLAQGGLHAERPRAANGRGQQVGYPDILVHDADGRPTYLECKVFGEAAEATTMRSFYLSPSANPKVCMDARHLLLAFGVARDPIAGSRDSFHQPTSFKLVDLHGLRCDVKYEFNADNVRLYEPAMILAQGPV